MGFEVRRSGESVAAVVELFQVGRQALLGAHAAGAHEVLEVCEVHPLGQLHFVRAWLYVFQLGLLDAHQAGKVHVERVVKVVR
jgi:hypothetical protein